MYTHICNKYKSIEIIKTLMQTSRATLYKKSGSYLAFSSIPNFLDGICFIWECTEEEEWRRDEESTAMLAARLKHYSFAVYPEEDLNVCVAHFITFTPKMDTAIPRAFMVAWL